MKTSQHYWIINKYTYVVDGIEVPRGRMKMMEDGAMPVISDGWRRATQNEVDTKQRHKGNYFNLTNV